MMKRATEKGLALLAFREAWPRALMPEGVLPENWSPCAGAQRARGFALVAGEKRLGETWAQWVERKLSGKFKSKAPGAWLALVECPGQEAPQGRGLRRIDLVALSSEKSGREEDSPGERTPRRLLTDELMRQTRLGRSGQALAWFKEEPSAKEISQALCVKESAALIRCLLASGAKKRSAQKKKKKALRV